MTRKAVWERYCEEAESAGKQPYGRSRFYALMSEALPRRVQPSMRFRYEPGQWAFADFSGKTVLVQGHHEVRPAEIFVGILPSSGLIFAKAVPDQKLQSWITANRAMFEYFGGCPANLGFDNLKAATTKWHDGEPILNRTFADFMLHYDVAGIACRPGHPQDKSVVSCCAPCRLVLALKPLRNQFSSTLSAWVLRGIRNIGCQIAALEVDFKLNFGPETGRSGQISRFGDDSTHLAPGACGQS